MNPLVIIIADDVVYLALSCDDNQHAEDTFRHQCLKRGITPTMDDFDNGYAMLPGGGSVCITHPIPEGTQGDL